MEILAKLLARFGVHISTPLLFILVVLGVFVVTAIALWVMYEPQRTSHGSAAWATRKHIKEFLNAEQGVALGKYGSAFLRTQSHIVTCAPTGSGKGIGCIIPALLEHPGSVICLDIKGENACVTARRRNALGSRPLILDPYEVTGYRQRRFNLMLVNPRLCRGTRKV